MFIQPRHLEVLPLYYLQPVSEQFSSDILLDHQSDQLLHLHHFLNSEPFLTTIL
jgi:hypothetical protein